MPQIVTATEFVNAFNAVVTHPECVQEINGLWHTSREYSRLFLPPAADIEDSKCFLPRVRISNEELKNGVAR